MTTNYNTHRGRTFPKSKWEKSTGAINLMKHQQWIDTVSTAHHLTLERKIGSLQKGTNYNLVGVKVLQQEYQEHLKKLQQEAKQHLREKIVFDIEYGCYHPDREGQHIDEDLEDEISRRLALAKAIRHATDYDKDWNRLAIENPGLKKTIAGIKHRQYHMMQEVRVAALRNSSSESTGSHHTKPHSAAGDRSSHHGKPLSIVGRKSSHHGRPHSAMGDRSCHEKHHSASSQHSKPHSVFGDGEKAKRLHSVSSHSTSSHGTTSVMSTDNYHHYNRDINDHTQMVNDLLDEYERRENVRAISNMFDHAASQLSQIRGSDASLTSLESIFTPSVLSSKRATLTRLRELQNYPPLHLRKDTINQRMDEIMRPLRNQLTDPQEEEDEEETESPELSPSEPSFWDKLVAAIPSSILKELEEYYKQQDDTDPGKDLVNKTGAHLAGSSRKSGWILNMRARPQTPTDSQMDTLHEDDSEMCSADLSSQWSIEETSSVDLRKRRPGSPLPPKFVPGQSMRIRSVKHNVRCLPKPAKYDAKASLQKEAAEKKEQKLAAQKRAAHKLKENVRCQKSNQKKSSHAHPPKLITDSGKSIHSHLNVHEHSVDWARHHMGDNLAMKNSQVSKGSVAAEENQSTRPKHEHKHRSASHGVAESADIRLCVQNYLGGKSNIQVAKMLETLENSVAASREEAMAKWDSFSANKSVSFNKKLQKVMEEEDNAMKTGGAGLRLTELFRIMQKRSALLNSAENLINQQMGAQTDKKPVEFVPEDMLSTRYLRLSKANIEELEEHCIAKGIENPEEYVLEKLLQYSLQNQQRMKSLLHSTS